jgi:malonate-semialdehyde dehydrogenase (acetylating) / methylmalonate-semialdehyde dehydrogenase
VSAIADFGSALLLTRDGIPSFNFPAMIPLWSINSIATGNSLILKPSERDPGAAMIIAELAEKAGTFFVPTSEPLLLCIIRLDAHLQ